MNTDELLSSQFSSYIFIPNDEILSFYCNEINDIDKNFIQQELISNKDLVIVPSDSNCLIHSILVNLYDSNFTNFLNILTTLSIEFEISLNEKLFDYDANTANYFKLEF